MKIYTKPPIDDAVYKYRHVGPENSRGFKKNEYGILRKDDDGKYYKITSYSDYPKSFFSISDREKNEIDIKEIASRNFDYFVRFSDERCQMFEIGTHLLYLNDDANGLHSDASFGEYMLSPSDNPFIYSNDDFTINIGSLDNNEEYLLHESRFRTRVFLPIERFIQQGASVSVDTKGGVKLYEKPDFNSQCELLNNKDSLVFFEVLDKTEELVCVDDRYSLWLKVKVKSDGPTGWIWGGQIYDVSKNIISSTSDLYQKFAKYERIKLPLTNPDGIIPVNRYAFITDQTHLLGDYYDSITSLCTLNEHDEIFVLFDSQIKYKRENFKRKTSAGIKTVSPQTEFVTLYVRTKDGYEGWIGSEYIDYDSWYEEKINSSGFETYYPARSDYKKPKFMK